MGIELPNIIPAESNEGMEETPGYIKEAMDKIEENTLMGNAEKESLKEILNNEEFQASLKKGAELSPNAVDAEKMAAGALIKAKEYLKNREN